MPPAGQRSLPGKLYLRFLKEIFRTAYWRLWEFHFPLFPATKIYFQYSIAL